MFFRLLIVSVVVCHTLAQQCGKRICGLNAECINNKCRCKDGFFGTAPNVECHLENQVQCVLQADPHITGYDGANADFSFPCKYRLTQFQTPLVGGTPVLSGCSFEIFGFNKIVNGKFFVSAAEISFAVGDFPQQIFEQGDYVKFDVNASGIQDSGGGFLPWGSTAHSLIQTVDVFCEFDTDQRFAIFSIPRCGVTVKFRPFDPAKPHGAQPKVPAISIVANRDSYWGVHTNGRFPLSLCGVTDDTNQLYKDRTDDLPVQLAAVYEALNQNLGQEAVDAGYTDYVLQDKESCQAAVDTFQQCKTIHPGNEITIFTDCSPFLRFRNLTRCLDDKLVKAFSSCLGAQCGAPGNSGCADLRSVTEDCTDLLPSEITQLCPTPWP